MRPNKFRNLVNNAIQHFLTTGSSKKFTPILLKEMHRVWVDWSTDEEDFRTGEETYGYSDNESIRSSMFYISDRWRCAFRLKWIIDGVENKHI